MKTKFRPAVSDEEKKYWQHRHWNPEIKMRWVAATEVDPANSLKGRPCGTIYYPDGTVQHFTNSTRVSG
jgi:hypothetical protein